MLLSPLNSRHSSQRHCAVASSATTDTRDSRTDVENHKRVRSFVSVCVCRCLGIPVCHSTRAVAAATFGTEIVNSVRVPMPWQTWQQHVAPQHTATQRTSARAANQTHIEQCILCARWVARPKTYATNSITALWRGELSQRWPCVLLKYRRSLCGAAAVLTARAREEITRYLNTRDGIVVN